MPIRHYPSCIERWTCVIVLVYMTRVCILHISDFLVLFFTPFPMLIGLLGIGMT